MREWLSGRASPCQGERREFESRLPLQWRHSQVVRHGSAKPLSPSSNLGGASKEERLTSVSRFYYMKLDIYQYQWHADNNKVGKNQF